MSVRTAVLVSGGGTNLQALIDASRAGKMPHVDICLTLSNRADAYALKPRGAGRHPLGGLPAGKGRGARGL